MKSLIVTILTPAGKYLFGQWAFSNTLNPSSTEQTFPPPMWRLVECKVWGKSCFDAHDGHQNGISGRWLKFHLDCFLALWHGAHFLTFESLSFIFWKMRIRTVLMTSWSYCGNEIMPGTKQVLNKYFLLGFLELEIDLHRNLLEFSVAPIIGDP